MHLIPIGERLKQLRYEKKLSQGQLARKVGVNASTVALYESGDRFPSLPVLIELSRVLGVTTDYLLGVSDHSDAFLDVTGLSSHQVHILNLIVDSYRELI